MQAYKMAPTSSSNFLHLAKLLLHFLTDFVTLADRDFTENAIVITTTQQ